jgi:hypothetical protein
MGGWVGAGVFGIELKGFTIRPMWSWVGTQCILL